MTKLIVAPLPVLKRSVAARVILEIDKVDDEDMGLYLEQELARIVEENPIVAAVLTLIRKHAQEASGEEAGQIALRAGITVYQTLKSQAMFNFRKFFLKAKQSERFKKDKKAK